MLSQASSFRLGDPRIQGRFMTVTAQTIVRNDDIFVGYAIQSAIDYVDQVIVFDTGSTDQTANVVEALAARYPAKIVLERKGPSDKARHTRLRQEMLDRTTTEWFLILDGDEVWTRRAMAEAIGTLSNNRQVEFVMAPFYACVGDLFHDYVRRGSHPILGRDERLLTKFIRLVPGLRWQGDYGVDTLVDASGSTAFRPDNSVITKNRFWHMTHLRRSSVDDSVYTSGGNRSDKQRPTYVGIGRRIREPLPEVFSQEFLEANRLPLSMALKNLVVTGASLMRRSRQAP
jgi:glycosyltransferase involved in cell wall biosynthesis